MSPFRGLRRYPTTYRYKRNESKDSFYVNISNRLSKFIDDKTIKQIDFCSSDNEFYKDLWNKLEVVKFMEKTKIQIPHIKQLSHIERFMKISTYENEA